MKKELAKNPITLGQIIFLIPLLVMFVGIIMYISSLQNGVTVANTNVKDMKDDLRQIKDKTDKMALDIAVIKTTLGVKSISEAGASAVPEPSPSISKEDVATTASKQDLPNPAPHVEQSQTVIAQAPSPTTTPQPTPYPTPTAILNRVIPSVTILGVPILERR